MRTRYSLRVCWLIFPVGGPSVFYIGGIHTLCTPSGVYHQMSQCAGRSQGNELFDIPPVRGTVRAFPGQELAG